MSRVEGARHSHSDDSSPAAGGVSDPSALPVHDGWPSGLPFAVRVRPEARQHSAGRQSKAGRWNECYTEAIPLAEHRYETYLKERAEEEGGGPWVPSESTTGRRARVQRLS